MESSQDEADLKVEDNYSKMSKNRPTDLNGHEVPSTPKEIRHDENEKHIEQPKIIINEMPCQEQGEVTEVISRLDSIPSMLRQVIVCSGVWLNMFNLGYAEGCAFIMFPKLFAIHSDIPLTKDSVILLTTISAWGSVPALIFLTLLMKFFGRKICHLTVAVCMALGFVVTASASTFTLLVVASTLQSLSKASIVMMAIIISEYSNPSLRGVFLNMKSVFFQLGICFSIALGASVNWRTMSWIGLGPSLLAIVSTILWPESPAWLVMQEKFVEFEKSFISLRGTDLVSLRELESLILRQRSLKGLKTFQIHKTLCYQAMSSLSCFTKRKFIKPFSVVIFLILLSEICGRYFFVSYAVNIISDVIEDRTKESHYIITFESVACVASILSCLVVLRYSRRFMLFSTTIAAIFLALFLACYLLLKSRKFIVSGSESSWIPIGLMMIYFSIVNLGTTTICYSLTGEVFPLEYRELGSLTSGIISIVVFTLIQYLSLYLFNQLNAHGMFFIYAICITMTLTFLYIELPETYGQTLIGIEKFYIKRKKSITSRVYD